MNLNCRYANAKPILLFIVWWGANSYYAIDSESFFEQFPSEWHVIDLTVAQTFVGIIGIITWKSIISPNDGLSIFKLLVNKTKFRNSEVKLRPITIILSVGSVHNIGTALTALSYSSIGATSTLVWKLTESFSALIMKSLILREVTMLHSSLAVCTVLSGVLTFSCRSSTISSYLPIITSNIIFPLRNTLVKLMEDSSQTSEEQYFLILLFGLPLSLACLIFRLVNEPINVRSIYFIIRNAILFNAYQFSSISLLSLFDTVTHSVLNTFKRFSAIVLSMLVKKRELNVEHVVGMNIALCGFIFYVVVRKGENISLQNLESQLVKLLSCCFLTILICIPIAVSKTTPMSLRQLYSQYSGFVEVFSSVKVF